MGMWGRERAGYLTYKKAMPTASHGAIYDSVPNGRQYVKLGGCAVKDKSACCMVVALRALISLMWETELKDIIEEIKTYGWHLP